MEQSLPSLVLTLILFGFSSCTTVHFRSNDEIPISFKRNPQHTRKVVIKGVTKFYFGGAVPKLREVYIDKEIKMAGYKEISGLIIYQERSLSNLLIKFLTLGIYLPTEFTFDGYTGLNTE